MKTGSLKQIEVLDSSTTYGISLRVQLFITLSKRAFARYRKQALD